MGTRHVALLRGINVGRASQVSMPELAELFVSLGCTDVRTLLRSGNVVFTASEAPDPQAAIASTFGTAGHCLVLSAASFGSIVDANPLSGDDPSRLVVAFLDAPPPSDLDVPTDLGAERIVVTDRAIYQWCPDGISKSRVPASFWRRLGPVVTARNVTTCARIRAAL